MTRLPSLLVVPAVIALAIWLRPAQDIPPSARVAPGQDALASSGVAFAQSSELSDLERELFETGRVVRQRTLRAPAALGQDARTNAAIEAQLARDPRLAGQVDVTTTDGRVTLAGRVDSSSDLLRAIQIAFSESDVKQVISTLQIARPPKPAPSPALPH
jgi:hypothetical protein